MLPPETLTGRFTVMDVWPASKGSAPRQAAVGELVMVNCVAFREGRLPRRGPGGDRPQEPDGVTSMVPRDNGSDMWDGNRPNTEGHWSYTIVAYSDILGTWRHRAR